MIPRPHRSNRALILLDMIMTLALIMIFLGICGRLFTAAVRLMRQADSEQATLAAGDSALAMLRRDVWSATALTLETGQTLRLATPSGIVRWHSAPGELSRAATRPGEQDYRWPDEHHHWSFAVSKAGMTLRLANPTTSPAADILLISQRRLLEGDRP